MGVVAALGWAATLAANWPGHFPPDAISQLAQGRSGVFNLWHPPVMAWLLGVADRAISGSPLFFACGSALFFASLAALAIAARAGWISALAVAIVAASPLALIYQGLVAKDVLFADAALAGFACLALAARWWDRRVPRAVLIGLAMALWVLAALARQNGAVVVIAGALALGALGGAHHHWRRSIGVSAVAVAGMAGAAVLASAVLDSRSDGQPEGARQWMTLQIYDLAGAVRRQPALPLPVPARLDRFIRGPAAAAYDPARVDSLVRLADWRALLQRPGPEAGRAWRGLIIGHPGLYLAIRWAAFRQVLATPDIQACAPVLVGIDGGDPKMLRAAGLTARDSPKDDWDGDYATAFAGTPVFSHLAYGGLAIVLLAWAGFDVARGRRALIATAGLLAAALAFTVSYFVISIACDYRYLYFLDVAAMAALVQRLGLIGQAGPRSGRAHGARARTARATDSKM